jgi:hypothetical protein
MICKAKISKLCTGKGNKAWNGMCSNCADKTIQKRIDLSLSANDWRENMPEITDDSEPYAPDQDIGY